MQTIDQFDGDFDLLPIRAHIMYGEVPVAPTYGDFALAVTVVESNRQDSAAHWFVEAVRERRINPGVKLEDAKRAINQRAAARMYREIMESM